MKLIPIITIIVAMASCHSVSNQSTKQGDTTKNPVGGDVDSMGCKASAGYTWSKLKNTCVRPWEDGIKLHLLDTTASYQTAAYVLIDSVQKEAEVFMAEEKSSVILAQKNAYSYANDKFNLVQENHCWTLSQNDKKLYREPTM